MLITDTRWIGKELVIATDEGPTLAWEGRIDWTVGPVEQPPMTPMYVFEPRPVATIRSDLESAKDDAARTRHLQTELRFCDCPHAVYAAFHGILPKVGMTGAHRIEDRLWEQGADAGFVIARADDRETARHIEEQVTFLCRIPQWRTHKEILPQLVRPVDFDRIQDRADDLRARLRPQFDPDPETVRLDDHPVGVLPSVPHRIHVQGRHRGKVMGAKGNHLFYSPSASAGRLDVGHSPVSAIKRSDLVGRRITIGDAE